MSSFIRFAGVAVVLFSLGYLVTAIPSFDSVPAITGHDAVSTVCAEVFVKIVAQIKLLAACTTVAEVEVCIKAIVALIVGCTAELLKINAVVAIEADAKLSLVACIAATICLLVRVLIELTLKLGLAVIVKLCVELDVCLKAFLEILNVCIPGIVALIFVAIKVVVDLCIQLNLHACLGVFGVTL